jgi:D-3-phosphoglycerate dehydrogenase
MGVKNMAKILITEPTMYIDQIIKRLESYGEISIAGTQKEEIIEKLVSDIDLLIVAFAKISERVIEKAEKLRGIIRCGTGVDNIDLEAATRRRIPVVCIPDYATNAVAEFTIALILSLIRRIPQSNTYMKKRGYADKQWTIRPRELLGTELKGRILGIIGFGRIGKAVAEKAKGLGMQIMVYDPYVGPDVIRDFSTTYLFTDLETLVRNSDVISVHCPLTKDTYHLINEEMLKLMKRSAYIINTARGSIIDEKALYRALKEGWIAGAALDVYEMEPPPPDNPIFELDNVILTPHIAWYTEESMTRLANSVADEAIRILKGEMPVNIVNREVIDFIKKR